MVMQCWLVFQLTYLHRRLQSVLNAAVDASSASTGYEFQCQERVQYKVALGSAEYTVLHDIVLRYLGLLVRVADMYGGKHSAPLL